MKRLINFIKRNESVFLAGLALVLTLMMLISMITPFIIEKNDGTLTEEAQALWILMFCFSSISLGIVATVIISKLNDEVRKNEARLKNFEYYDE